MMTPITRKEKYINQIVGGGDTAPETPQTREEFFFADILGEVIAPSPVTRVEKYLSAIAGQYSGDLPTPTTRIEYFLAKAAGMDITVPVPITREEIFWSNYSAIVDFEVEGVPPLTYKAIEGALENYRIYGNTVGGESVGDRTGNLFDGKWENKYIATNGSKGYSTNRVLSSEIHVVSGQTYTVTANFLIRAVHSYNGTVHTQVLFDELSGAGETTFTIPDGSDSILISLRKANDGNFTPNDVEWCMLNEGSTALPYEPYGYKVPATVSNGTDTLTTPIYLPEQIKKVGDEAEYISYADQKLHRVGADDIDVTLPALPTLPGTNTLTVGTEVQPSNVYIKYEGER